MAMTISDYIAKYDEIRKISCIISLGNGYFQIKNTRIKYDGVINRWFIPFHNADGKYLSFEEVLDSIDSETQIELLFHLDLFR